MLDFITNIEIFNLMTIGVAGGVVATLGIGGYLFWAWSKDKWPF